MFSKYIGLFEGKPKEKPHQKNFNIFLTKIVYKKLDMCIVLSYLCFIKQQQLKNLDNGIL